MTDAREKVVKIRPPQRRLLALAATDHPLAERDGWTVEASFVTGQTVFGVPRSTLWACQRAKWMRGMEITQLGQAALSGEKA